MRENYALPPFRLAHNEPKGRLILCRRPQVEHKYFHFLCISTNGAMEFPAISLVCCMKLFTNGKQCGLRAEVCVLRSAAYTWPQANRMGFSCIGSFTQRASEIAENSITPLVEMQRKLKYVQLGAARGLRQSMNPPLSPSCSLICRMLPVSFCLRWSKLKFTSYRQNLKDDRLQNLMEDRRV